jgi:hypothetical protein
VPIELVEVVMVNCEVFNCDTALLSRDAILGKFVDLRRLLTAIANESDDLHGLAQQALEHALEWNALFKILQPLINDLDDHLAAEMQSDIDTLTDSDANSQQYRQFFNEALRQKLMDAGFQQPAAHASAPAIQITWRT